MSYYMKKLRHNLHWLPRLCAIGLILFFSIFALDVLNEPDWPVALFMHLIPSFILLAATVIAWKESWIGGLLFLALGILFSFFFHSLAIGIPVMTIGILFWISKKKDPGKKRKS